MSINSQLQVLHEEIRKTYNSQITIVPIEQIEKVLSLTEKLLTEFAEQDVQDDQSNLDVQDKQGLIETYTHQTNQESPKTNQNSKKKGKWTKRSFNHLKKPNAEESKLKLGSIEQELTTEMLLQNVFETLREYWEPKVDPILDSLSIIQGNEVLAKSETTEEENKPIPISILALEKKEQLLIKFLDLYSDWGALDAEEDVQEEAILWRVAAYLHYLGQSNLDSLHALLQLGMWYRENDEFVLSEQVLGNTLHRLSESQGEDSLPTLQAALQLTLLYNKAGQYEEALEMGEDLVESLEDNFGPDSGETLLGVLACADALVGLGEFEAAGEILQELLPAMEEIFGGLHEETLKTELLFATILIETEAADEAMEMMQDRVERIASEYGIISLESIEALEEWAGLTVDSEDIETADEMYQQALEWRTQLMNQSLQDGDFEGEEEFAESILSPALLNIANINMEKGKNNEALQIIERVLRLEEKIDLDEARENQENNEERSFTTDDSIEDSIDTALTRKIYADCLSVIGREPTARREYKRSLEVLLNHRGENIDEVLDIQEALEQLDDKPSFSVIDGEKVSPNRTTDILEGQFGLLDDSDEN